MGRIYTLFPVWSVWFSSFFLSSADVWDIHIYLLILLSTRRMKRWNRKYTAADVSQNNRNPEWDEGDGKVTGGQQARQIFAGRQSWGLNSENEIQSAENESQSETWVFVCLTVKQSRSVWQATVDIDIQCVTCSHFPPLYSLLPWSSLSQPPLTLTPLYANISCIKQKKGKRVQEEKGIAESKDLQMYSSSCSLFDVHRRGQSVAEISGLIQQETVKQMYSCFLDERTGYQMRRMVWISRWNLNESTHTHIKEWESEYFSPLKSCPCVSASRAAKIRKWSPGKESEYTRMHWASRSRDRNEKGGTWGAEGADLSNRHETAAANDLESW